MQGYAFTRPRSVLEAVRDAGADTAFLAGGTTLVDQAVAAHDGRTSPGRPTRHH